MKEVILAGRPNSGKSTLFNRLASANQKVGNYAGCTVEKKTASVFVGDREAFEVTDLPGIYSFSPNSLDEEVALRHLEQSRENAHVVFVLDGNNLEQELVLPLMLKNRGYKLAIAVNMMDEVRANKKILDMIGMTDLAGVPFFPVAARSGEGVEILRKFLDKWDSAKTGDALPLDNGQAAYRDARTHARKINSLNKSPRENFLLDRDSAFDRFLLHPVSGPLIFLATMFVLFQSIFTWAKPVSDLISAGVAILQEGTKLVVTNELLSSLLSDGVLAGVGAVLVFVPQIAILFLLIGLLEYSGYLPRVAYMVDRLMKPYGLDGKVFIPLLSSVACAVPGIMATRTIESERTRIVTIMISPLMTCSARLPVYTLLIATFIPSTQWGIFSLPGLVMFAMYALGVVMALVVALILHMMDFQKRKHVVDFIHLPHYRVPNWPELFRYVWTRVSVFLRKAGTIIAGMAVLLWILLSFPNRSLPDVETKIASLQSKTEKSAVESEQLGALEAKSASYRLENSLGGQLGKTLEPLFHPIGYDWKLTIGVLASLAAREVFVSTMGTVFSLGDAKEHPETLTKVLLDSKDQNGKPAYTVATCISLLLFFAFSLQCISTIGVARRETNSWRIPAIMFVYMFALAYGAAFVGYRLTSWLTI